MIWSPPPSTLLSIQGILGAAQNLLEAEGKWKMVTLIGGVSEGVDNVILP
jgi:hypothetical protein